MYWFISHIECEIIVVRNRSLLAVRSRPGCELGSPGSNPDPNWVLIFGGPGEPGRAGGSRDGTDRTYGRSLNVLVHQPISTVRLCLCAIEVVMTCPVELRNACTPAPVN